ncbi:uncharacterized protein [Dendropsophus ebraccatus]|uniref:uncharacterized protein n=1 Tax=Dendropsophus ebraccatus TaxID=150705 RepID=UPI0038315D9D
MAKKVQTRWKSIRNWFTRVQSQQEQSGASPHMGYAEQLSFLLPARRRQETSGNYEDFVGSVSSEQPQPVVQLQEWPTTMELGTSASPGELEGEHKLVGPPGLSAVDPKEGEGAPSISGTAVPQRSSAAARPADRSRPCPVPPSRSRSTSRQARRDLWTLGLGAAEADAAVMRFVQKFDTVDDVFDFFGHYIAARCRLLPARVSAQLRCVIDCVVSAFELAEPQNLPSPGYIGEVVAHLCGLNFPRPVVSLAP